MKNENSTARRMRMQDERIEEDQRLADAAAREAAEKSLDPPLFAAEADQGEQAGPFRLAADEKADLAAKEAGIAAREAEEPAEHDLLRHSGPALPLWELYAKNRDAPPFHFTGVAVSVFVAAASAEDARHIAAGSAGDHGVAWLDDTQSDCVELCRTEPGLIAQDLGA